MVTCTVCGGEDFEKHAGFIYCAVCQTQSQDYHEEEYDYHDHEMNIIRRQKSQQNIKPRTQELYDDGLWTTWEGFNFILYGMTQEIKKIGVTKEFEEMVLKIWAAYLRKCQIAFISKNQEAIPKLGFSFKQRDAKILYNFDLSSKLSQERTRRSRSYASNISNNTVSSMSSRSKKSLALQKGKIITADYQDNLFSSFENNSNLADETLETLGKSSWELETSDESLGQSGHFLKCFKDVFNKEDYVLFKNSYSSKRLMRSAKNKAKKSVQFLGKNKLLSIIHLALLMTGSTIQLSDLLRFIRESYLSYAKVTHFFPNNMKFPKNDFSYVEVTSDYLMPTHLHQRKISSQLASLLKIERIPTPNMNMLVDRYCQDLNLPKQLAELCKKLLRDFVPSTTVPRSKALLPSYEAWAMASVLLVMKLLFGLNDKTENFLSRLAREVNSMRCNELFVFEDWQTFIECRKTVLTNFHYPTQEQLSGNSSESSKKFLETLIKESKDEYRNDRFIPYSKYYMESNLLEGLKNMLNSLSKPQGVCSLEFQPSLTPQVSHMNAIMQNIFEEVSTDEVEICDPKKIEALPKKILKQNFENCDLLFALDPYCHLNLIEKESDLFIDFNISQESLTNVSSQTFSEDEDFLFNCSTKYWIFEYPDAKSGHLDNFKEDVLEKIPFNFRWLITECARMLEMNVRDIYDELLRLEKKLNSESLQDRNGKNSRADFPREI